jgi:hypothetical protein
MIAQERLYNIRKLPDEEILQILRECVSCLAVCDMTESAAILKKNKRTIYLQMTESNSITIGRHKFPIINIMIKK